MKKILCIGDLALDVISQLKEPITMAMTQPADF